MKLNQTRGTLRQRATLFALSLFLLLAHVAASRAQEQPPSNLTFEGGDSFSVPFELVDNRIFVGVWLEGKGPFKFILDTGGYGGISVETAKRIGARLGKKDARRKSVRLTVQSGATTREVVVRLRDLV